MKVVEVGHIYDLDTHDGNAQRLTFFKNLPESEPGRDGVLCQEVLRALIDRMHQLNAQVPCHESLDIIEHLRAAMVLFEVRAARRLLEKSYKKVGLHIEQLPAGKRGHVVELVGVGQPVQDGPEMRGAGGP